MKKMEIKYNTYVVLVLPIISIAILSFEKNTIYHNVI